MIVLFTFFHVVSFATQVPYFGSPDVVLQDVQCNGAEFSLANCTSPGIGFTDSNCSFPPFIAGVICQQGNEVMVIVQTFTVKCKEAFFVLFFFVLVHVATP